MPTISELFTAILDDVPDPDAEVTRVEMGLGGGNQYFYRIWSPAEDDYVGGVVEIVPA